MLHFCDSFQHSRWWPVWQDSQTTIESRGESRALQYGHLDRNKTRKVTIVLLRGLVTGKGRSRISVYSRSRSPATPTPTATSRMISPVMMQFHHKLMKCTKTMRLNHGDAETRSCREEEHKAPCVLRVSVVSYPNGRSIEGLWGVNIFAPSAVMYMQSSSRIPNSP